MASIQRIVSPLTGVVSYRAQVRVKGRVSESETFPNRKEAKDWAASIETAVQRGATSRTPKHAARALTRWLQTISDRACRLR